MLYASHYLAGTDALADSADLVVHAMVQWLKQDTRMGSLQRVVYVTQDQTRCEAFAIALCDVNEAEEGVADGFCRLPSARGRPSTAPTSRRSNSQQLGTGSSINSLLQVTIGATN